MNCLHKIRHLCYTKHSSNQEDALTLSRSKAKWKAANPSVLDITAHLTTTYSCSKYSSPKDSTGHQGKRGGNVLHFVATQSPVHVLWKIFIQHLYLPVTVLCASSAKNIIPFCLYENQIDFCQWKYRLCYWWIERQVCCSDHLPKYAWNLELSRESARGAISAIFICIFHTNLFTQKEQKVFTWVRWLWGNM